MSNKIITWSCEFKATNELPKLNLYIDSYSNENQFIWRQQNLTLLDLENPFSQESSEYNCDQRIPPTIKILKEHHSDLLNRKNMNALELWSRIETMIYY